MNTRITKSELSELVEALRHSDVSTDVIMKLIGMCTETDVEVDVVFASYSYSVPEDELRIHGTKSKFELIKFAREIAPLSLKDAVDAVEQGKTVHTGMTASEVREAAQACNVAALENKLWSVKGC